MPPTVCGGLPPVVAEALVEERLEVVGSDEPHAQSDDWVDLPAPDEGAEGGDRDTGQLGGLAEPVGGATLGVCGDGADGLHCWRWRDSRTIRRAVKSVTY